MAAAAGAGAGAAAGVPRTPARAAGSRQRGSVAGRCARRGLRRQAHGRGRCGAGCRRCRSWPVWPSAPRSCAASAGSPTADRPAAVPDAGLHRVLGGEHARPFVVFGSLLLHRAIPAARARPVAAGGGPWIDAAVEPGSSRARMLAPALMRRAGAAYHDGVRAGDRGGRLGSACCRQRRSALAVAGRGSVPARSVSHR